MVQPVSDSAGLNPWAIAGFGFLCLSGAAMMIFGVTFLWEAQASKNWPIAQGEVLSTRTRRQSSTTNNTSSPSSRTYTFEVTYAYEVAGEKYESDRFSLGEGSTASRTYKERSEAQVAANHNYPQAAPSTSITTPKIQSQPCSNLAQIGAPIMPLVLGTVFLASTAGVFWLMRNTADQAAG